MEYVNKKLGEVISEVDKRNTGLKVCELIGVTIEKCFIPSVANTNGTDLSKYKIISKKQFACSLMQVSRDNGVAISLYNNETPAIMSPAYYIFEISVNYLLPEYLELIFSNPEFDREATFNAIGGVRGTLTWEDFCDISINIPPIEYQNEIVEKIANIKDRIQSIDETKNQIIDIASAIFRNTISQEGKCITESILANVSDVIKSGVKKFDGTKKFLTTSDVSYDEIKQDAEMIQYSNRPSRANMTPQSNSLWFAKMKNTKKYIFIDNETEMENFIFSTGFAGLNIKNDLFYFVWCFMLSDEFEIEKDSFCNGTTQEAINEDGIAKINITYPTDQSDVREFNNKIKPIFEYYQLLLNEKGILNNLYKLLVLKIM